MQLAHYEIVAPLGAGGMGEVWRARDTKLKREVALKILPAQFASDSDRLARFEREAVVLASLNHPHIASIHELGHAEDVRFLVLELVEGPTLDARLLAGPVPVRDVLAIATQIAEALEAAHDKGILHRDLKPANVKLTPEGKVKVLDFGLAKAFGDAASAPGARAEATLVRDSTEAGMVMGTPSYMSPEQAEGQAVDKRTDVWSFGVLLFEMLTRRRLFDGKSDAHVLVHVMEQEPDWSALPPLPEGVLALLQRCLQKDRNQRLRDIGDVRIQLQGSQTNPMRVREVAGGAGERRRRWLWPAVAAAGIVAAIAIGALLYPRASPPVAAPAVRFDIARPEDLASSAWVVISPDGRQLTYLASLPGEQNRLWLRSLETQEARPLPATLGFSGRPFWSADSRSLTFSAEGKVRKVDAAGGPAQVLADLPGFLVSGYWPSRDRIRYSVFQRGLFEIPSSGGNPVAVPVGPSLNFAGALAPSPMPGGNFVFCQCYGGGGEPSGIYVATADGAPPRQILPDVSIAQYAPSADPDLGYVLFSRGGAMATGTGGTLMAQGIHPRRLRLVGDPIAIAERVNGFSASDTGVLVYSTDTRGVPTGVPGILQGQLTWFDRQGRVLSTIGDPGILRIPRLSPDGRHVALEQADPDTQNMDIYLFEFARGVNNRFTFDAARDVSPVWSADGSSVIYTRMLTDGSTEWYRRSADLTDDEELLFRLPIMGVPSTLTPNGRFTLYTELMPPFSLKAVELTRVAEARESIPVVATEFAAINATLSPDGKWFAYVSNESGTNEIYVRSFNPDAAAGASLSTGGRVMVSSGGVNRGGAVWRPDGRELFYLAADGTLMAVEVDTEPTFTPLGRPQALFKVALEVAYFDVSADGERFLISVPVAAAATAPPYKVVLNWTATLQ
jgi:eukaryotic-like serine/threonine-protein kinase